MEALTLNAAILAMLGESKAHLCIHDLSGFTSQSLFQIESRFVIHANPFCDQAKTTKAGMELCLACKALTIKKAVKERRPFCGFCPMGVFEWVIPVLTEEDFLGILYMGNLLADRHKAMERIAKACRRTGVAPESLLARFDTLQAVEDLSLYEKKAKMLGSYLALLWEREGKCTQTETKHWAVNLLINHIEEYYGADISLCGLSRMLHINEQYAGRIFKRQTGISFHQYLNRVRMKQAVKLLEHPEFTIAQAAYQAGYQNVTYFNRLFHEQYGYSPKEYRKQNK